MSGIMSMVLGAKTAIAAAVDAYFNLVTLLLPGNGTNGAQNNTFLDSSSNNFTITRNGNTTQGTFSPFSQTGWSNFFNTGYLTVASNAAFDLGSGDATIETWIYPTSSGQTCGIFDKRSSGANYSQFPQIALSSGAIVVLVSYNGSSWAVTINGATPAANAWTHIALVRSGNTWTLYVNGSSSGTPVTAAGSVYSSTDSLCIGVSTSTGTNPFAGYISNARIVKGTAVYTSAFTPPTAALTAITNTSLLTCQSNRFVDNSTNAFSITPNSTYSVQAFSPFAPTAAYSAATNGGSGYFDGSGDYLSVASNTAFDILGGSFTIEYWFYPVSVNTGIMVDRQDPNSPFTGYSCRMLNSTSNSANLNWDRGTTGNLTTTTAPIKLNQWNHIAYTCDGTTLRIYANGTLEASTTNLSTSNFSTALTIGSRSTEQPTNGYYSGFILRKGTATYTGSTYTVPTAPPTNITNTSLLCNFTNAGITDATAKNDLETVGNAQISTTQSKFGGSSIAFDGDDTVTMPARQVLALGSGNWTIECWVRLNATGFETTIGGSKNYYTAGFNGNFVFRVGTSNLWRSFDGQANQATIDGSFSWSTGVWYHVAWVRNGSTVTCYRDGTSLGSTTDTKTLNDSANGIILGSGLNAYVDDLRITVGQARYTTTFTPPTAAFPLQ